MELINSVLIVEDEQSIAELLKLALADSYLEQFNLVVDHVSTAEQARFILNQKKYDLVILDWMLPGEQGIDLLKSIKTGPAQIDASFLMMTAKSDADSVVLGLEAGADDYMTKPFDLGIFKARVKNLLQRRRTVLSQPASEEVFSHEGLKIDLAKVEVILNHQPIHLTPSEFKLLGYLLQSRGKVLTRERLIDLIQGEDVTVTGRTIDTHVFALRKKLGDWAQNIETIRGVGYRVTSQ